MTLSERQRKPAFSCPDPQPIRYRENRRWSVPGPVVRNSGPRGIFPPNPTQKGPPHNPAGPVFIPSSPPERHRPPAHLCRSAGLRPAGQTVLRTVLGGGLRPPSPCRLPGIPTPKRPPERRALLSVNIPPSARPPAPPRSSSRCPPASPAAAPSGRAKTPPYPSRRCGSARIPSGSRCKAATHCAE